MTRMKQQDDTAIAGNGEAPFAALSPLDEHNRRLQANTHPPKWRNPVPPDGRYNLVVIGAGTAGLVSAAGAAGLGAKVALIERDLLGGDCLNVGCVPSKALIRCGRAVAEARRAGEFGLELAGEARADFSSVMERMRRLRAQISPNDSAQRFSDLGVDVYLGNAAFTGPDTIEVDGLKLRFARAVIATGARAAPLPIEGLEEAGYLTNETVFSLTELPARLAVIGAGPIGTELSQAFARLGSRVMLVESESRILNREDADAAAIVEQSLRDDGVQLVCGGRTLAVSRDGDEKVLRLECEGKQHEMRVDAILLGVGRRPNVDGLGLEAAGVDYEPGRGVSVNDHLRTSNRRIYAAGDVCSRFKFTHAADAMARIVIQNALFFGRAKAGALTIPWCTYTDPELAHVGLYAHEAEARGLKVDTFKVGLAEVDRAILDGETDGFVKIHVKRGSDRILGATIVAAHAGDLIAQLSQAMATGTGLGKLARTIFPYPTQAEAIKKTADAFNRTRLTPFVKKLFKTLLAWRR